MDPNETLRIILSTGDRHTFAVACEDLADWLNRGGFKPSIPPDIHYVPGTGTLWSLLSPNVGDDIDVWTLAHYDYNGRRIGTWRLEGKS